MLAPCCGIGAYDAVLQGKVSQARATVNNLGSREKALAYLDNFNASFVDEADYRGWSMSDQIQASDDLAYYIDTVYPTSGSGQAVVAPLPEEAGPAAPRPQYQVGPQFPGTKTVPAAPDLYQFPAVPPAAPSLWKQPLFLAGMAGAVLVAGVALWAMFGRRGPKPVPTYQY